MNKEYIPVSCDLVDLIEIAATNRAYIYVLLDFNGLKGQLNSKVKTWVTEQSIEYLITDKNLKIRLDHILEFNNTIIENNCVIRTYQ